MKALFQFALLSAFILAACTNKKNTTTTTSSPVPITTSSSATTVSAPVPQATQAPVSNIEATIRYVISFYSMASGNDTKVNEEFVNFLDSYPKKINYEPKHWGTEGEIDYCLSLTELSPSEQTEFINKANVILAKSKTVQQKENAQCEHANWPSLMTNNTESPNYPLVVSFISKASGIDTKMRNEFENFIHTYPKKIAFEPTHWGREGEIDYCLKLSELSMGEQADFITKAKKILAKSTLVNITENAECIHNQITFSSNGQSKVRYIVDFYSPGGGIDSKTYEEFVKFLDSYPIKMHYEPIQWGPEGETAFCLPLIELTPDQQIEFIKKAKVILSKSEIVHQKENEKCEYSKRVMKGQ